MPLTRPGLGIADDGVCLACKWFEQKASVDWESREEEFRGILEAAKQDSKAPWDCVVGVSGQKDSTWQALRLKELGINPLLVQYQASDGTELGKRNLENLVNHGFSLISSQPNADLASKLTKKSLIQFGNLATFSEVALFALPLRVAMWFGISTVFFGENPALEAGDTNSKEEPWDALGVRRANTVSSQNLQCWTGDGISERDLLPYTFPSDAELDRWGGRSIYMGYFLPWSVISNASYSIKHGLEVSSLENYELGHPNTWNSLDTKNSIVNGMLKHIKLGFGHATEFIVYHIREGRLTRAEGARLVRELDGRCQTGFVNELCSWISLDVGDFWELTDKYRGDMWKKTSEGEWSLDNPIWEQEDIDESVPVEDLIQKLQPVL